MRRRNQTPSPWNQAGPSAPCKRSKLAAGALDPVQEAPCCGDASLGETGGFAMQPSVCARRQQDAARHQLGVRFLSALATNSSSLAIASSKGSDRPRSSSAIPSCTSRISAPCRRHIVKRRAGKPRSVGGPLRPRSGPALRARSMVRGPRLGASQRCLAMVSPNGGVFHRMTSTTGVVNSMREPSWTMPAPGEPASARHPQGELL